MGTCLLRTGLFKRFARVRFSNLERTTVSPTQHFVKAFAVRGLTPAAMPWARGLAMSILGRTTGEMSSMN
jgi:hypothetical protein